ncbi:hypothetical protein [Chlorobaculum thiosulfatiphilum]|nr:hypothetical protein [Chlorobaculum thiosulfatiphilum]
MYMYNNILRGWFVHLALIVLVLQLVACSGKDSLSDGAAAEVIEQQILTELFNTGVPLGSVTFMDGFEAALGGKENQKNKKFHPRRLELAKKLSQAGLISLTDKSSVFDVMTLRYTISLTPAGEQKVKRKEQDMAFFDLVTVKVERVVSNTLLGEPKADNPEPRRLVMAAFSMTPTDFGIELLGKPDESQTKGRVRAKLKFDSFDKKWKVESFDLGDDQGNWLSNNVEM